MFQKSLMPLLLLTPCALGADSLDEARAKEVNGAEPIEIFNSYLSASKDKSLSQSSRQMAMNQGIKNLKSAYQSGLITKKLYRENLNKAETAKPISNIEILNKAHETVESIINAIPKSDAEFYSFSQSVELQLLGDENASNEVCRLLMKKIKTKKSAWNSKLLLCAILLGDEDIINELCTDRSYIVSLNNLGPINLLPIKTKCKIISLLIGEGEIQFDENRDKTVNSLLASRNYDMHKELFTTFNKLWDAYNIYVIDNHIKDKFDKDHPTLKTYPHFYREIKEFDSGRYKFNEHFKNIVFGRYLSIDFKSFDSIESNPSTYVLVGYYFRNVYIPRFLQDMKNVESFFNSISPSLAIYMIYSTGQMTRFSESARHLIAGPKDYDERVNAYKPLIQSLTEKLSDDQIKNNRTYDRYLKRITEPYKDDNNFMMPLQYRHYEKTVVNCVEEYEIIKNFHSSSKDNIRFNVYTLSQGMIDSYVTKLKSRRLSHNSSFTYYLFSKKWLSLLENLVEENRVEPQRINFEIYGQSGEDQNYYDNILHVIETGLFKKWVSKLDEKSKIDIFDRLNNLAFEKENEKRNHYVHFLLSYLDENSDHFNNHFQIGERLYAWPYQIISRCFFHDLNGHKENAELLRKCFEKSNFDNNELFNLFFEGEGRIQNFEISEFLSEGAHIKVQLSVLFNNWKWAKDEQKDKYFQLIDSIDFKNTDKNFLENINGYLFNNRLPFNNDECIKLLTNTKIPESFREHIMDHIKHDLSDKSVEKLSELIQSKPTDNAFTLSLLEFAGKVGHIELTPAVASYLDNSNEELRKHASVALEKIKKVREEKQKWLKWYEDNN